MDMSVTSHAFLRVPDNVATPKIETPASPPQPSALRTPTRTVSPIQVKAAQDVHAQAAKAAQAAQAFSMSGGATLSAQALESAGPNRSNPPQGDPDAPAPSSSRNVWKYIATRSRQPVLRPETVPETLLAEGSATASGAVNKTPDSLRHRRPHSLSEESVDTKTGHRPTASANNTAEKLKEA